MQHAPTVKVPTGGDAVDGGIDLMYSIRGLYPRPTVSRLKQNDGNGSQNIPFHQEEAIELRAGHVVQNAMFP